MTKKDKLNKFLSEIGLAIATLVMMIPVYYFVISSFKNRKDVIKFPLTITAETFTLDNFPYVIGKMKYWQAMANTAFITAMALIIVIILASLAGFAIARCRHKIFSGYYKIIVTLMVIPFIGCLLPLTTISVKLGLYNSIWGCILIQAAWNMPFSVFLYTGFMQGIPVELEEAAYLDGCKPVGVFARIFLPLLAPVTATCAIRQGVGMWNDYLVSRTLLNENKNPTLMVGITGFFGSRGSELAYAMTGVLLVSIPMVILFLFLQKYFIKGIAAGAVKG
ncbi:MAG: carbohydrate ABC transporter permease [Oscillospiraceae bacterium]|nr:carbohydrate ABC transporter permease [Oscillospiraceae bacterium]